MGQYESLPLRLADLTWSEAGALLTSACVPLLPVGAIEAHGPHLPLDTDVVIAEGVACRVSAALRREGTPSVVLPPIAYGVSHVGGPFPGTTPLSAEVVTATVEQVLRSTAGRGPRRMAVVNAHLEPAHIAAVAKGARRAETATGARIAVPDKREARWASLLSDEFRRGSRHAGAYEPSLMLAAAPGRVRVDRLGGLPPVWVDLPARLQEGATTFAEVGMTEAYVGSPAAATAAEGERLFEALTAMVLTALLELEETR